MIVSAVVSSADITCINNNFRNTISAVDREVDELTSKLEQNGTLGSYMTRVGACYWKTIQHVINACIVSGPTDDINDDSHMEVEDLEDVGFRLGRNIK